jgi:hypothetical protein
VVAWLLYVIALWGWHHPAAYQSALRHELVYDIKHLAVSVYCLAGMHQLWRMDFSSVYAEPFSGSSHEDLVDGRHFEAALGQPSGVNGGGE